MKKFKEVLERIMVHFRDPDHDMRKQFATTCNTVAAILVVNFVLNNKGIISFVMLVVAVVLWLLSVAVVRKEKSDDSH